MKLHTLRLLAAVLTIAAVSAISAFQYLATWIPVETGFELAFYSVVALFAGVCFAGGVIFLAMFVRGGTLPSWFFKAA